jgi:hypothetical protein
MQADDRLTEALLARIHDAQEALDGLTTLAEVSADLPPLVLARTLLEVDAVAATLARAHETLAAAAGTPAAPAKNDHDN